LIELARPMKVTFHRAFDMCNDLEKALEELIELGCERVLTSGGAASAIKGAEKLKGLITQAAGRISIMPGAGVKTENIAEIIRITGAKEFHASAKHPVKSKMEFRKPELSMGTSADEFSFDLTDTATVKKLIELANSNK